MFSAIDLPSTDKIESRFADLRRLGFSDPVKMITSLPAILGLAVANIEGKLADLRRLGFSDPVKMITSSPAILGLAVANIEGKLADLRRLGFSDPVKMITSLPAILGYAVANIEGKLAYARNLGIDGRGMAERFPPILGYNLDRIRLCVRLSLPLIDDWEVSISFLITKDPATSVASSLLCRPKSLRELRSVMRLRAGRPDENQDVIGKHPSDKLSLAYRRYRPAPPHQKHISKKILGES